MKQLNLKVLVPMYFEDNIEDIFERANSLGMDSLTEDEQYFMDNYHRLFDFMNQLSPAEVEELENATDNDEVYNKYSNAEMIEANKKKCKNRKNKTLTDNNKNGDIYTKEAVEKAVNNLHKRTPIIFRDEFGEKVIGTITNCWYYKR